QEQIIYSENAYNNPKWGGGGTYPNNTPIYCEYGCSFYIPAQGLGSEERHCDKCKKHWSVSFNEYGDIPPNDHTCEGKRCSKCGNTYIGYDCQKCEAEKNKRG